MSAKNIHEYKCHKLHSKLLIVQRVQYKILFQLLNCDHVGTFSGDFLDGLVSLSSSETKQN